MGNVTAEDRSGIGHFGCILRPLPDNCREQGWLLKKSS
jgi:hypothetical protein